MFNYFAFSCTYNSLWSNNQVKDNLFRLGAQLIYLIKLLISCSHYFLWSHLDVMKPQSLQVRTLANMLNEAAYSYTHHFCGLIFTLPSESLQVMSAVEMLY